MSDVLSHLGRRLQGDGYNDDALVAEEVRPHFQSAKIASKVTKIRNAPQMSKAVSHHGRLLHIVQAFDVHEHAYGPTTVDIMRVGALKAVQRDVRLVYRRLLLVARVVPRRELGRVRGAPACRPDLLLRSAHCRSMLHDSERSRYPATVIHRTARHGGMFSCEAPPPWFAVAPLIDRAADGFWNVYVLAV